MRRMIWREKEGRKWEIWREKEEGEDWREKWREKKYR